MQDRHRKREQRRRNAEGQAWLTLAGTQAERCAEQIAKAIENDGWDVVDEAYERLCEILGLASEHEAGASEREARATDAEQIAGPQIDTATAAVHRARACGWWPRTHEAITAHEEAESKSSTTGLIATVLQELANDETRYEDIAACARATITKSDIVAKDEAVTVTVHPENAQASGPNDGAKMLIVVGRTGEVRRLSHRERKRIEVQTRKGCATYGMHNIDIEVADTPPIALRWYRVQCEDRQITHFESKTLAPSAAEAERRVAWRQRKTIHDNDEAGVHRHEIRVTSAEPIAMAHAADLLGPDEDFDDLVTMIKKEDQ